jgi:putative endonuclease
MNNQKIAKIGEKIGFTYLIKKGYQIIAINQKYRVGEIDLIAKKGGKLIFVEVKTRTNWKFGYPEQSFNYLKKRRFKLAIGRYLCRTKYRGSWQVDLIAIDLQGNKAKLRHYQSVELN